MPKPANIAGIAFKSQAAAERYAQAIRDANEVGSTIPDEHVPFVEALLTVRPVELALVRGRSVVRYYVDWQPPEHSGVGREWTRCFWAELDDGTRIHFSFKTAIRMIADGSQP